MAASFDEFYGNVKKQYPDAKVGDIQAAYTKSTGEPAFFQSGPTRQEWRSNLKSQFPDMSDSDANSAYDKLYARPKLDALTDSLKGGLAEAASTVAGWGVAAQDLMGIDTNHVVVDPKHPQPAAGFATWKAAADAAAQAIPKSPSASSQMFPQGFDFTAPLASLGNADVQDTYGNPNWLIENTARMAPSQLPVLAGGIVHHALGGLVGGAMEGESTYATAKQKGLSYPLARGTAQGIASGVIEALPFIDVGLRGPVNVALKAFLSGTGEAAEEVPGVLLENLKSMSELRDPKRLNELAGKMAENMAQVFGPAALMGGFATLGDKGPAPEKVPEAVAPAADAGAQLRAALAPQQPPAGAPPVAPVVKPPTPQNVTPTPPPAPPDAAAIDQAFAEAGPPAAPTAPELPVSTAPSVADLHDLIKNLGIPNDKAFLDRTEAITGERHLDNLKPEQRTQLADTLTQRHVTERAAAAASVAETEAPYAAKPAAPILTNRTELHAEMAQQPLDHLIENAPESDRQLGEVGQAVSEMPGIEWKQGPIKTADRIREKVHGEMAGDHSTLADVVRGTALTDSPGDYQGLVDKLAAHPNVTAVYPKGITATAAGYADGKILVRLKSGLVGEVQVMPRAVYEAKTSQQGRDLYERMRTLPQGSKELPALEAQVRALYASAFAKSGAAWSSAANRALQSPSGSSAASSLASNLPPATAPQAPPLSRAATFLPSSSTAGSSSQSKNLNISTSTPTVSQEAPPYRTGAQLADPSLEGQHASRVSTRLPTGIKPKKGHPPIEDAVKENLELTLDVAQRPAGAESFEKNVNVIGTYPNYPPAHGNAMQRAEQYIAQMVDNLLWLYDKFDPNLRERASKWYDGARGITTRWSARYGLSDRSIAASMAVLSPQRDWFQNVSLAERVLDTVTQQWNRTATPAMAEETKRIFAKPQYKTLVDELLSKPLGELSSLAQAAWVRLYDETHNDRGFRIITPEGHFGEYVLNAPDKKGNQKRTAVAWGSLDQIEKAISVVRDGSRANITAQLGTAHKVRNFYNNIVAPDTHIGDVTIDTHAVAADQLRPLSGNDTEPTQNFGGTGSSSSSALGTSGTYPIHAEAYRRAAAARGIQVRKMQSITWEAARGLFTDKYKANKKNIEANRQFWDDYRNGKASIETTRQRVLEHAGGINQPEWTGSDPGGSPEAGDSSYASELARTGIPGATAAGAGVVPGAGERTAARSAESVLEQAAPRSTNQVTEPATPYEASQQASSVAEPPRAPGQGGKRASNRRAAGPVYVKRVALRKVGEIPYGVAAVTGPSEAAHVLAGLRRGAQEQFVALVTDENGVPLQAIRHSIGATDSSSVEAHTLVGAVLSIPRAANVWFTHNHPSGAVQLSDPDRQIGRQLQALLQNTHVFNRGMVQVAAGKGTAHYGPGIGAESRVQITPKARTFGKVPVTERMFTNVMAPKGNSISSSNDAIEFLKGKPDGAYLLDTQHQPLGMAPNDGNLLQAVHETGARAVIVKGKPSSQLVTAVKKSPLRLLDVIDEQGSRATQGLDLLPGNVYEPPAAHEGEAKYDTGTPPTHMEIGGGRYNTHKFLDALTGDDVNLLDQTMQQFAGDVETQRRGTRTWGMTDEAAAKLSGALKTLSAYTGLPESQLLKTPMIGSAANAETIQLYASRVVEATKALKEQAAKVAGGDASPQAVLDYEAAKRNLAVWFTPFSGFVSESARALQSMRQFARMYGDAKTMMGVLGEDVARDAAKEAGELVNLSETAVAKRMRQARPTDWLDKVLEFRSAMMLYGPLTDIRNLTGNAVNAAMEMLNAYGAQAIGKLRGTEGASFRVANAQVRGMVRGIVMGWANAKEVITTGRNPMDVITKVDPGQAREAIGGKFGKVVRFSFRKLEAEDAIFKGIGFMGSLHASAMADAQAAGGSIEQINARAKQLLDRWHTAFTQQMELSPHEQVVLKAALDYSRKVTFQTPLGPSAGMLNAWMSQRAGRLAKIPVPFFKTSVNIMKTAYEYSPFGFIGARSADITAAQQNALLSRATIGSGLAVAAWMAAAAGLMTGGISDDPRRRALQKEATGATPYSIGTPETGFRSYAFLEPAGTLMGTVADLHDLATTREFKDIPDIGVQLMKSIMTNIGDKTWMRGVSDIASAWSDPRQFVQGYVQNVAGSLVPGFSSQLASANDPYMRDAQTTLESLQRKIPGLRNQLAAKMTVFGEPMVNLNQSMFAPYAKSDGQNNPVAGAMIDLGVIKEAPGRTLMGVDLTTTEYEGLSKAMGQARYKALQPMVTNPNFVKQPTPIQAALIEKTWDQVGNQARMGWLMTNQAVLKRVLNQKVSPRTRAATAAELFGNAELFGGAGAGNP